MGKEPQQLVEVVLTSRLMVPPAEVADPAWIEKVAAAYTALGNVAGTGATVTLEVAPQQVESAALGNIESKGESHKYRSPEDYRIDPRFGMSVEELLRPPSTQGSRCLILLQRDGLGTLRDLLTVGKRWVKDIQNIGADSLGLIEEKINNLELSGITWTNYPDPTTIALMYPNIAEVPAERALKDAPADLNMTVAAVLDVDQTELAARCSSSVRRPESPEADKYGYVRVPNTSHAAVVRRQARAFAQEFIAAQLAHRAAGRA